MKKVVYILTLAVAMTLTACNGSGGDSSAPADSSGSMSVSKSSVADDATKAITQPAPEEALQPSGNKAAVPTMEPPKAPLSPEEAEKYKESISLLKTYGEQVAKCTDAVKEGKAIDDDTKKQIAELQKKLDELEKAGKMHKDHIDLYKFTNDIYNQLLNKNK